MSAAASDDQTAKRIDTEHLRILSIMHYVFGGLQLFSAITGLVFVAMGSLFAAGGSLAPNASPQERVMMQFCGMMFSVFGLAFVALCLVIGCGIIYAGWCLARAQAYIFCFIVAVLECTSFPFGTALGVFTIIVLVRESVKERFERAVAG